jgi:hypothetical protein
MKTFLDLIAAISCFTFILSAAVMSFYFLNRSISTYWQLQWKVLWLEIIFRYRDHTKINEGRVGSWYYIFLVNIFIALISISFEVAIELRHASWPIIFIVTFSAILLFPLLGFAIYNMSMEKYY